MSRRDYPGHAMLMAFAGRWRACARGAGRIEWLRFEPSAGTHDPAHRGGRVDGYSLTIAEPALEDVSTPPDDDGFIGSWASRRKLRGSLRNSKDWDVFPISNPPMRKNTWC